MVRSKVLPVLPVTHGKRPNRDKKDFYSVYDKQGNIQSVVKGWKECKAILNDCPESEYKPFSTAEEALQFLERMGTSHKRRESESIKKEIEACLKQIEQSESQSADDRDVFIVDTDEETPEGKYTDSQYSSLTADSQDSLSVEIMQDSLIIEDSQSGQNVEEVKDSTDESDSMYGESDSMYGGTDQVLTKEGADEIDSFMNVLSDNAIADLEDLDTTVMGRHKDDPTAKQEDPANTLNAASTSAEGETKPTQTNDTQMQGCQPVQALVLLTNSNLRHLQPNDNEPSSGGVNSSTKPVPADATDNAQSGGDVTTLADEPAQHNETLSEKPDVYDKITITIPTQRQTDDKTPPTYSDDKPTVITSPTDRSQENDTPSNKRDPCAETGNNISTPSSESVDESDIKSEHDQAAHAYSNNTSSTGADNASLTGANKTCLTDTDSACTTSADGAYTTGGDSACHTGADSTHQKGAAAYSSPMGAANSSSTSSTSTDTTIQGIQPGATASGHDGNQPNHANETVKVKNQSAGEQLVNGPSQKYKPKRPSKGTHPKGHKGTRPPGVNKVRKSRVNLTKNKQELNTSPPLNNPPQSPQSTNLVFNRCRECNNISDLNMVCCVSCKTMWHFKCTNLPDYMVSQVIHSGKYVCVRCTKVDKNIADYYKQANKVVRDNSIAMGDIKALADSVKSLEAQMVTVMQNEITKCRDSEVTMIKKQLYSCEQNLKEEKKKTKKMDETIMGMALRISELEPTKSEPIPKQYDIIICNLQIENSVLSKKVLSLESIRKEKMGQSLILRELEEKYEKLTKEASQKDKEIRSLKARLSNQERPSQGYSGSGNATLTTAPKMPPPTTPLTTGPPLPSEAWPLLPKNTSTTRSSTSSDAWSTAPQGDWNPTIPLSNKFQALRDQNDKRLIKGRSDPLSSIWDGESLEYGGTKYVCSAQALCHQRAKFTGANALSDAILNEKNPDKITELGKLIEYSKEWEDAKLQYMTEIIKCKVAHCPTFRKELRSANDVDITETTANEFKGIGAILMNVRDEESKAPSYKSRPAPEQAHRETYNEKTGDKADRESQKFVGRRPNVLLMGNSIISDIDPSKIGGVAIKKVSAMTLDDCTMCVRDIPTEVDIVVVQSITNDVKYKSEDECARSTENLIMTFKRDHPNKRLVLSMPPPTRNSLNNRIIQVSKTIREKFNNQVGIIDNTDSFCDANGPKSKFYRDEVHLSNDGIRLLVSKIKKHCLSFTQAARV